MQTTFITDTMEGGLGKQNSKTLAPLSEVKFSVDELATGSVSFNDNDVVVGFANTLAPEGVA